MGLDSYIFKVKAPSNEQMRQVKYCTWDDIKEKLDLKTHEVLNERRLEYETVVELINNDKYEEAKEILIRHTNAIITQVKPNTTSAFDAPFISEHNRLNVCTKYGPKNIASEIKPVITNILANLLLNLLSSCCFIILLFYNYSANIQSLFLMRNYFYNFLMKIFKKLIRLV